MPMIRTILGNKGKQVWALPPDATVFDALVLLAEKDVGALIVTEGAKLVGVISERDYARRVFLQGKSSKETLISEIMTSNPITVTPDHTVDECMRLMTDYRVRHLPVLDGDRLVGVVSIGDLVNSIISMQAETIHQLSDYIEGKYPG